MTARNQTQIRSAIVIAMLVVLVTFGVLFALSVIGEEQTTTTTTGRPPATGAPIVFPTNDGTR